MEKEVVKNIISRFDDFSFKKITTEFFNDNNSPFNKVDEDEDIFFKPIIDSYGDSLHSVFLFHYIPIELLNKSKDLKVITPSIELKVKKIANYYRGKYGQWGIVAPHLKVDKQLQTLAFLTNFSNYSREEYDQFLFPQYDELLKKYRVKARLYIGSIDSFIENSFEKLNIIFNNFILSNIDGLSFSVENEKINAEWFSQEKNLSCGVLKTNMHPYEPIFSSYNSSSSVIEELAHLLEKDSSEAEIEKYLKKYYQDIFGFHYDRIEAQLWLKFPELDIRNRNRKIDIFLRNSIEQDWELMELKKPSIKLTSTYRDVPTLAHQVTGSMQQLRNYKKLLASDPVKKKLAKSGIEYFEPTLKLIVGRKPQISIREWRWLKATNENEIKIIHFDDLIAEMKTRLDERKIIYNKLKE